jgi:hypothetical protein
MNRPQPDEYPEYYNLYVNLVRDGDIVDILEQQSKDIQQFISSLKEESGDHTYAFGKWTIKEILGHLIDSERIFAYRALRIARKDKQNLPGYDSDEYVKSGNFYRRTLQDLREEMLLLRAANLKQFTNFDESDLSQKGVVNDMEFSVIAILYIMAGHELHHINFIKDNYLN